MSDFNQTRSFNLGIAQEVGVPAALVYDEFTYKSKEYGDSGGWFYATDKLLLIRMPFGKTALREATSKLIANKWVEKKVKKLDGTPTTYYRILRTLRQMEMSDSDTSEMSDSDTSEMSDSDTSSIYNNSKENNSNTSWFETAQPPKENDTIPVSSLVEQPPSFNGSPAAGPARRQHLGAVMQLINPKEKVTDTRLRTFNARLKEYTFDEIYEAALVFSRSEWHRKNGQMTIDNLLAPSKFGRWYAKRGEADNSEPDPDDDGLTQAQREVKLAEALKKEREWRRQNGLN